MKTVVSGDKTKEPFFKKKISGEKRTGILNSEHRTGKTEHLFRRTALFYSPNAARYSVGDLPV